MLEEILRQNALTWADLNSIGAGIGPGNFTGIRMGVSAARGLALGLGIPAVGVSILEAQAFGIEENILSTVTAPRGRAYVQTFHADAASPPQLMAIEDIDATPDTRVMGTAAAEVAEYHGLTILPQTTPTIANIAHIAAARHQDTPARPTPMYLRAADAAPARIAPPNVVA